MKPTKPMYELMVDIETKQHELENQQKELIDAKNVQASVNEQVAINQAEIIVNQEYANCLLEMNMGV